MAVLEVKDLIKKYGQGESEVIALDQVTFSVERGEFVAIVGASGSGKSTLMNMIGGIDYPTSGSIIIDGMRYNGCVRMNWRFSAEGIWGLFISFII